MLLSLSRLKQAPVVGANIAFGFAVSLVGSGLHVSGDGADTALVVQPIEGRVLGAIGGTLRSAYIPRKPLKLALWLWLMFLGGQFLGESDPVWAAPVKRASRQADWETPGK